MKKNGEYVGIDEKFIPEDEKYVEESVLGDKEESKIKMKKVAKRVGIGYLVLWGIFVVIIIGMFIFIGNIFFKTMDTVDGTRSSIDNVESQIKSQISNQEVQIFNSQFEIYSGTGPKIYVNSILDNVVKNNKNNKDKLITVAYNDNTTNDSEEIIELKKAFEDGKEYEIILDYSETGLVNKVRIEDIK